MFRKTIAPLVLLFLIALDNSGFCQEIDPQVVGRVDVVDVSNPDIEPTESNLSLYWSHTIRKLGSRYLRLRFTVDSEPRHGDATLRVSTFAETNAYSVRIDSSLRGKTVWTPPINGQFAEVRLLGSEAPEGLKITLDRIAYTTEPGRLSSIIGLDQRQPIWTELDDPVVSRLHGSIAKISYVKNDKMYVCTGFMLDDSHMMTNDHCVNTQELCGSAVALFGYEQTAGGAVQSGTPYFCESVVNSNFELDYAVLRIAGTPGATWGSVRFSTRSVRNGDALFVIQHPAGEAKQISIADCTVSQALADGRSEGTDFAHTCDTLGGSSGSPVFTRSGDLVGLHHYGRGAGYWNENRAVRMERITAVLDLDGP